MSNLKQRLDKRIAQVDQLVGVQYHFTPQYPKYHSSPFTVACWCGTVFRSTCLDTCELARMIDFFEDHAGCPPKEGEAR